jgi:exodeoxyribonuclease VII large subunit
MTAVVQARLDEARRRLELLSQRRPFRRPFDTVHELALRLDELETRLTRAARRRHARSHDQLAALAARLESLSPLSILSRGYSITTRAADGQLLLDSSQAAPGEQIVTRLNHGRLVSRVEEIRHE